MMVRSPDASSVVGCDATAWGEFMSGIQVVSLTLVHGNVHWATIFSGSREQLLQQFNRGGRRWRHSFKISFCYEQAEAKNGLLVVKAMTVGGAMIAGAGILPRARISNKRKPTRWAKPKAVEDESVLNG